MKSILYINQVVGPMCIDRLNMYVENGAEVTLITGAIESTTTDLSNQITLIKRAKYSRDTAVKRLWTWSLFLIQSFFVLIRSPKNRHLFIVSNPPFAPFLGLFMNRFFKMSFSLLIYDIYPDVLVHMGYIQKGSAFAKVWGWLNKKTFACAKNIFTISEGMAGVLSHYISRSNIKVVYNWVDTSKIKPIDKFQNSFVKQHGLEDKFVVLYSGNFGATHNIEVVLDVAERLKEDASFHFMMIGGGVKKSYIEDRIKKDQLKNVTLLPFQSIDVLPYSLASADVAIVTLGNDVGNMSVPSKTYYMLAAGCALAVIAPMDSELANLCSQFECGEMIQDEAQFLDFLHQLNQNPEILLSLKRNARIAACEFTSKNVEAFHLDALLN